MTSSVTVRPATVEDADAMAALRRVVFPYKLMPAAMVRRSITRHQPEERSLAMVAEAGGSIVGWGTARLNIWTSVAGQSNISVLVDPEHRGHGIGSALVECFHDHLGAAGAARTQVFARQDSAAFAQRRGYEVTRTMHYAGVPLTDLPPQPDAPAGVRVHAYDDAELDPHAVYTAEMLASADEPGDAPLDSIDYDRWLTDFWNDPSIDRTLSTAAVSGDEVLAFTIVETDGERLWSAFSGTVPQHRGRGLSKLVKSAALHRAAAHGVSRAFTSNDDRNGPMLAVNDWLGYRRVATEKGLSRTL